MNSTANAVNRQGDVTGQSDWLNPKTKVIQTDAFMYYSPTSTVAPGRLLRIGPGPNAEDANGQSINNGNHIALSGTMSGGGYQVPFESRVLHGKGSSTSLLIPDQNSTNTYNGGTATGINSHDAVSLTMVYFGEIDAAEVALHGPNQPYRKYLEQASPVPSGGFEIGSEGNAIDEDGRVGGLQDVYENGSGFSIATVWYTNLKPHELAPLATERTASVTALAEGSRPLTPEPGAPKGGHNHVEWLKPVGYATDSTGHDHAVYWYGQGVNNPPTPAGPIDLGTPAGFTDARANAISTRGHLIAGFASNASSTDATVWKNGHPIDLNTLLAPGSGWQLSSASGVNDRGVVVGEGIYNSNQEAFVLQLPNP
jgi:hypothetical protein